MTIKAFPSLLLVTVLGPRPCGAAAPLDEPVITRDEIIQFEPLEHVQPAVPQPDILFRNAHRFYINAAPGERIGVALSGVKSSYTFDHTAVMRAKLFGPDGKALAFRSGDLKSVMDVEAAHGGSYRLLVSPGLKEMYRISITNRDMVVQLPLHIMSPRGNVFYFFVPSNTASFRVIARGGGGKENVGVDVFGPDRSLVGTGDSDPKNARLTLPIDVPKHQDGTIWSFVIRNPKIGTYDDVHLKFSANIPPYVAFAPHRLMREKTYDTKDVSRRYGSLIRRVRGRVKRVKASSNLQKFWRKELLSRLDLLERETGKELSFSYLQDWKSSLVALELIVQAFEAGRIQSRKYLPYGVKPITNTRIVPDGTMDTGVISDTLRVVAARGEYEPASFVLSAQEDIPQLRLQVSNLKAKDGKTVPSEAVDIRVVKCWYQDTGSGDMELTPSESSLAIKRSGKRELMPELLLKDDSLIKTEAAGKRNTIRWTAGGEYLSVAEKKQGYFPMDSDELLPVSLKKNTNKQFWITVHVPEDAAPGEYEGAITLVSNESVIGAILLKLKVLPFTLEAPYYYSSMYYYPPSQTMYWYSGRDSGQYQREMENMYAHGVTDVMAPYNIKNKKAYESRHAVGMTNKTVFYRGYWPGSPTNPAALTKIKDEVKKTMAFFKTYGVEDVYIYGVDEAFGKQLTLQRPAWEAIHEAGGKIFVSGYVGSNFEAVGDIQDMLVCAGYPDKKEAAKWHSKGRKIVCYASPQGGLEKPETYRKNYGLLLWQMNYDGAMTYIYHWGRDKIKTWDDPLSGMWKQHNMVYPTLNGVVDTLQWEGYREGVDDVRYLTTLLKAIDSAGKSANTEARKAAEKAKDYLSALKDGDINVSNTDMDLVRSRIVGHIMSILAFLERRDSQHLSP